MKKHLLLMLVFVSQLSNMPAAQAKKVYLEWKEVKNATNYELQIARDNKVISTKKVKEDTIWKGNLNPGYYTYKIRGVDKFNRPGRWSSSKILAVLPERPEAPLQELEDKTVNIFEGSTRLSLKWKPIEGIKKYHVLVQKDGKTFLNQEISGTETTLTNATEGSYRFSIAAIVEVSDGSGRRWDTEHSKVQEFEIKQKVLTSPVIVGPIGDVNSNQNKTVKFEWKEVDGAEEYELELRRSDSSRSPANLPSKKYRVKKNATVFKLGNGKYAWKVRAIASVVSSSTSSAAFTVAPKHFEGSGYVAASGMVAPYTYKVISPATNAQGNASSFALTGRISGEYYFNQSWGVGLGFDNTLFVIANENYNRKNFEALAKYRFNLSQTANPWSIALKAGFEVRDYFEIFPTKMSIEIAGSGAVSSTIFGPAIGLDLRKQFSHKFSLGIKTSYFLPVMVIFGPISGLGSDANTRNINLGVQGLYWFSERWAGAFGGYWEQRSLGYDTVDLAKQRVTGGAEKIYMDGLYFFGSLIYSFGR